MQNGNVLISRINKESCPVSNSHQHHFEFNDNEFRCRLCGFWIGEGNGNFLYLKRKMGKLDTKVAKLYAPIKRFPIKKKVKRVIQDGDDLTQKQAFLLAYVNRGKKWYLDNYPVAIEELTASNFTHVLSKAQNKYPWFKYYWKNIVILPDYVHHILDHGNSDQLKEMVDSFTPQERYNWDRFLKLREELKVEYPIWTKEHPGEYKV